MDSEALESLLEALRVHGNNAAVQLNGLAAVAALVSVGELVQQRAMQEGALEIARAATTTRFPGNEEIGAVASEVMAALQKVEWGLAKTAVEEAVDANGQMIIVAPEGQEIELAEVPEGPDATAPGLLKSIIAAITKVR